MLLKRVPRPKGGYPELLSETIGDLHPVHSITYVRRALPIYTIGSSTPVAYAHEKAIQSFHDLSHEERVERLTALGIMKDTVPTEYNKEWYRLNQIKLSAATTALELRNNYINLSEYARGTYEGFTLSVQLDKANISYGAALQALIDHEKGNEKMANISYRQFTCTIDGHNKFWNLEVLEKNGKHEDYKIQTIYGKVGSVGTKSTAKWVSGNEMATIIAGKIRKGYKEKPSSVAYTKNVANTPPVKCDIEIFED